MKFSQDTKTIKGQMCCLKGTGGRGGFTCDWKDEITLIQVFLFLIRLRTISYLVALGIAAVVMVKDGFN